MARIYISGPVSDRDEKEAREHFAAAEVKLRSYGHKPINPLLVAQMFPELEYKDYIRTDLALMRSCDAIYMLKGWHRSEGAKLELANAVAEGLNVMVEE